MTTPPSQTDSLAGEVELRVGNDPKLLASLRQNLKVRALFVPGASNYPSRARLRVKIYGTDPAPASLVAEVVFTSPAGLGLQILEMDAANEAKINEIASAEPGEAAPTPEAAPQATPQTEAPQTPTAQTGAAAQPPSAAPAPVPAPKLTVPMTGALKADLPEVLQQLSNPQSGGVPEKVELPLDTSLGLVQRLAIERFTGRLIVESDDQITTHVFFREGIIVGGHHEPEDEIASVGYALRKAGKLPEADYRDVRRKMEETGGLEVKLLAEIIDAGALQKGWRVAIFQSVGKALAARKAKYRLESGAHVLEETMPLPIQLHRVLYRAIVLAASSYSNDELLVGLEPYLNLYVSKKETFPIDMQKLRLDEKELRFLNVTLLAPIRLRTIFSVSALNRSGTLRNLYALFLLDCLAFLTHYQPPEEEFLPHLNRVWAEMQSANHFDIVQVHWTVLGEGIEKNYKKTRKEWEETLQEYQNREDYAPLIKKILAKIDDSFRFISDDNQRRQYRDEIIEAPKRKFSADLLSQHTRTYLMRGDKKQARAYIEMALDIVPGNIEFRNLLRDCGG